jgi:hypothetical protein
VEEEEGWRRKKVRLLISTKKRAPFVCPIAQANLVLFTTSSLAYAFLPISVIDSILCLFISLEGKRSLRGDDLL